MYPLDLYHVYRQIISVHMQGGTSITADLAQNDRVVHVDFFNGMETCCV